MHTPPNAAHLIPSGLTPKVKLVLGKQTGTSPCQAAAAAAPLALSVRGESLLLREQAQHGSPDHTWISFSNPTPFKKLEKAALKCLSPLKHPKKIPKNFI